MTLTVLAACGGQDVDPEGDDGAAEGDDDAAEAAEITRDNTLVIATPELFLSRDPLVGGTTTASEINLQIYESPIFFKFEEEDVDGGRALVQQGDEWEPNLAEHVDISEDGLTYTFHLQQGVTFYPSGNEMTAEDWHYMFERALNSPAGFGGFFASNVAFSEPGRIIDDYTYELTLDRPNPQFHYMAVINSAIIDSQLAQEHATDDDPWSVDWLDANAAGTGPYYLVSADDSEIVLEANPDYRGEQPFFKRLVYRHVPDAADRALLLRANEVDIAYRLSPRALNDLATEEGIQVLSAPSHQIDVLFMDVTAEPTSDPFVRKAIIAAIPYDDIIESVFFGRAREYDGIFMDEGLGYVGGPEPVQDLDQAREYLAQSSSPEGFSVDMLVRADAPHNELQAQMVRDALAEIDISVNIVSLLSGDYTAAVDDHPLVIRTNHPWLSEGIHIAVSYVLPDSFFNYSRLQVPEIEDLYGQAFTMDEEVRAEAYERMQELWYEQDPVAILARFNQTWALRDDIRNFSFHELLMPLWWLASRSD